MQGATDRMLYLYLLCPKLDLHRIGGLDDDIVHFTTDEYCDVCTTVLR